LVRKILLSSMIGLGRSYVAIGIVYELIWLPFDVRYGPGVASHESRSEVCVGVENERVDKI